MAFTDILYNLQWLVAEITFCQELKKGLNVAVWSIFVKDYQTFVTGQVFK